LPQFESPQFESNEASGPAGSSQRHRRLRSVAVLSISLVCAATVCAASARYFWIGDLATHFRVQYAVLSLLGVILFLWIRRPVFAAIALATCVVNITSASSAFEWPLHAQMQTAVAASNGQTLRMAAINVYYRNTQYEKVERFLREEQPDVAVLVEITPKWRQALDSLGSIYTYRYYSNSPIQRDGIRVRRGVMLMSRWPIEHTEPIRVGR
jgi:endonuclease/exonuclease/phosphatase (EEP) superfamily protein YafD